jgi:hypothetical protein
MAVRPRRLSAATRTEVLDLANSAVPTSLGQDITIGSPDLKSACQAATEALAAARKEWEKAGRPKRGKVYTELVAAAVTAQVMCALAGA